MHGGRVLLTGATGYIGSRLLRELEAGGCTVRCVVGDIIGGWRVDAYEPDRLLRLSAGLKLPGRGWLEFRVDPLDGGARSLIRQTATFDPKGIARRLYWYGVLPLHALVFRGLLRRIAQRAVRDTAPGDQRLLGGPTAVVGRGRSDGVRRRRHRRRLLAGTTSGRVGPGRGASS
jgi:hypothetical protein